MAVLGRGITGLPLSSGSMLVGVGGVVDELPIGLPGQVLTIVDNANPSEADYVQWVNPSGGGGGGDITGGQNLLGSGAQVYASKSGSLLQFRRIASGSGNVTVTEGINEITIAVAAAPVTSVNTQTGAVSLGLSNLNNVTGSPTTGQVLQYNGTAWAPVTISVSGEANTASNLGTGTGVFSAKSGVDLQFRSIKAGTGVGVALSGSDIIITNTDPGSAVVPGLTSVGLASPNSTLSVGNSPLISNGNLTIDLPAIAGVSGIHPVPSSITVDGFGRITSITNGTVVNPNKFLTFNAKDSSTATAASDTSTFTFTGTDINTAITGTSMAFNLANVSGLTPGSYTHASITVDAKGRVTVASNGTLPNTVGSIVTDSGTASAGSSAAALTLNGINGITSSVVTGAIKVSLTTTGVTAGTYGATTGTAAQVTVDTYGRITAAQNKTVLQSVAGDLNPALGGNLNVGPYEIGTTSLNGNIVIRPNGTGSISASSAKIINLATPTNASDAATKAYVDIVAGAGTATLDGLLDVTITTPAQGQYLTYNSGTSEWINTTPSLTSLSDIDFTTLPTTGQYLYYNGISWVASDIVVGSLSIDDLVDVTITTPLDGQYLIYNAMTTQWVNSAPTFFTTINATTGSATVDSGAFTIVGTNGIESSATGSTVTITNTKTTIASLDDIDFGTPPTADQVLQYNGTDWVPYSIPDYALHAITTIVADDTNSIIAGTNNTSISISGSNGIATTVSGANLNVALTATLNNITDVNVSSIADGDALVYDFASSKWINKQGGTTLAGLTDVDVTTLANNYILTYDLTNGIWVSVAPSTIDQNVFTSLITDNGTVSVSTPTTAVTINGANGIFVSSTGNTISVENQITLDQLTNVSVPTPTNGQVLTWNGTAWVAVTPTLTSTLDDLTDVVITTPANNQLLQYNGIEWINAAVNTVASIGGNTGSLAIDSFNKAINIKGTTGILTSVSTNNLNIALNANLDDLLNVNVPTPTIGDVLYWDGSQWSSFAAGSFSLATDPNPTLTQDLYTEGHEIKTSGSSNIILAPGGDGQILLGDTYISKAFEVQILSADSPGLLVSYDPTFTYMAIDYHYSSTAGKRIGTLMVLNDGTDTSITDTGTELGTPDVEFTAAINDTDPFNILVEITMASPDDSNVKFTTRKMQA